MQSFHLASSAKRLLIAAAIRYGFRLERTVVAMSWTIAELTSNRGKRFHGPGTSNHRIPGMTCVRAGGSVSVRSSLWRRSRTCCISPRRTYADRICASADALVRDQNNFTDQASSFGNYGPPSRSDGRADRRESRGVADLAVTIAGPHGQRKIESLGSRS